jgi:hypothetical protein
VVIFLINNIERNLSQTQTVVSEPVQPSHQHETTDQPSLSIELRDAKLKIATLQKACEAYKVLIF